MVEPDGADGPPDPLGASADPLEQAPDGWFDLQCVAPDRPGVLATVMEALHVAGIPLAGFNAFTGSGTAIIHLCTSAPAAARIALRPTPATVGRTRRARLVNVPHRASALADLGRALAQTGTNVEVCYLTHDPVGTTRLVLCVAGGADGFA